MTDDRAAEPTADEPTEAERAAIDAARAAKKARKAQEKADRLAAEYQRLTAEQPAEQPAEVSPPSAPVEHSARTPLLVAAGALLACLAFLVVAIVVHVNSGGDPSAPAPTAVRDQVLLAARQDVVVLNSLDYHDIDGGLARWKDASTGQLRSSFDNITAADRKRISDAKAVTTARILEAAVVSLDTSNGQARVIASVELTVRPATGKPVIKRERQQADLSRVGDSWKISGLQQVGVTVQ